MAKWNSVSRDLDQLAAILYFHFEPERRRRRNELLEAIRETTSTHLVLKNWVRAITYKYSDLPLSCAGSLQYIGGRFNMGIEISTPPFPALYLAQNFESAFREKYQRGSQDREQGLTPSELALMPGDSMSTIVVNGLISSYFDLTTSAALIPIANIFRTFKLPDQAKQIGRKLQIPPGQIHMLRSADKIQSAVTTHNWRVTPTQFGHPAPSQILAELIKAAGIEAILYPSSKGAGNCLAIFPENLTDQSWIELVDGAPPSVTHVKLDASNQDYLCGWDSIPRQYRKTSTK
ncbi:RES family NAD+ phosphorylase [Ottowia oryzae]